MRLAWPFWRLRRMCLVLVVENGIGHGENLLREEGFRSELLCTMHSATKIARYGLCSGFVVQGDE